MFRKFNALKNNIGRVSWRLLIENIGSIENSATATLIGEWFHLYIYIYMPTRDFIYFHSLFLRLCVVHITTYFSLILNASFSNRLF